VGREVTLSARRAGAADDEPRPGGILREGYDYDFSRCDPTGAHVDPAWCAVYEALTVTGPDGRLGPMIAEAWEREPPFGSLWRFRIRPDLRFQSGDACDAAAVADALRLHADPVEAPINAFFWRNVKRIDADGDDGVVIQLHEPSIGMPRVLRSWHSAVHNQARRRAAGEEFGRTTCDGTGPFRFVECVPGSHLDVARWDGYGGTKTSWEANRGPAHLDGIRWVPILDDRERASALADGRVDCIQNASLLDVARLSENRDLEVIEFQQSALVYLGLDHGASSLGLDDVRVRRAVSHAIDRRALVAKDLLGHGWPAFGPIPSHSRWYTAAVEASAEFDPRKAGELLDAAGLRAGPEGRRLELETVVLDDATVRRSSETIKQMLEQVGIRLSLVTVPGFAEFYARLRRHPPAFVSKWFWPEPVDAIVGFIASWGRDGGPNFQGASDPAVDRACRAWETAQDDEALQAAATDIQLRAAETLPLIPLFSPAAVWAHHRRVRNWRPHRHDLYPLYGDVWLAA
jgi:peptide/nickel transport system substrate-binding protein